MELFFSREIDGSICRLDADESAHCVKVLRHREGDDIHVIDGEGTLYTCRILSASPKEVEAQVTGVERDWGSHPYRLRMAVCPTKNTDRYEWFAEKATELGVDVITPVIGDHSERKVFKTDRLKRILLSASKQSLKGAVPQVDEALPLRDLIRSYASSDDVLKLICCCYEGEERRMSIGEVLSEQDIRGMEYPDPKIVILIGPEGDFSREEVALALECGFRPVHLGPSRLRTETAALAAVAAVYFHYCGDKGM
ncbi:MAG: 16S rRNA (uracil(1498)-N(3))-methyltransferase [Bacteroidales bacterium]|nr:16S rRNA (uracil(1498)-N(3))-methyltransferase [Bacteroidales bacterium]